jgi:hypothetical protein
MAMVYQKGTVYLKGTREKKWYGKFRVYFKGRNGEEVERTRKVVLGSKSELRKWEAEQKLQTVIQEENGKSVTGFVAKADDSVTFGWFVKEKYIPMRSEQWRPATKQKTEFEIDKYLVENFKAVPLRDLGPFELQVRLNKLAESYSDSIVRHAFVNIRSITRLARKLKFLQEDPAEELKMPQTKEVKRPTMTAEQIAKLIDAIEDVHDLCLMSVALFCATRTSETLGLTWKSYAGDKLIPLNTAFEGELYPGRLKTRESRNAIPIPEDVVPIVEVLGSAGKGHFPRCPDVSDLRPRCAKRGSSAASGEEFPEMENPSHRREAGYPEEARDLSSDAPNAWHRHAGPRDDEGCAADPPAREYQNDGRHLHAGNSGKRALGNQLTDAGNFPRA